MADEGTKFAQLLTKKGPMDLPIGVWILVGGGGLFFAYRTYKKTGTASPKTATTGTTGNGVDALGGGTYSPVGGNIPTSDTGANSSGNSFADNNSWASAAINYLVGLGYDAGIANQAIGLYLASQPMTSTQMQAMVNVAIQHLGPPPQTVAPVNGNIPPVQGGGTGGSTNTTKPTAITNLTSHVYVGSTNLTWNNPKNTDYVKIAATSQGNNWGTTYTDVPTIGITGPTGHLFVVDSLSRGVTYQYKLTPMNSAGAGPTASVTVKNA